MDGGFHALRLRWQELDGWMVHLMQEHGIHLMRMALAVIFIWFGLLKVTGQSPVVDLVAQTIYWVPAAFSIPLLGIWETLVGLGLLFGIAPRLVLFLFWFQLAGTFLVLVLRPDITFQHGNPFLLTVEGEFVMKNLVLITGGLVIGGTVRHQRMHEPSS